MSVLDQIRQLEAEKQKLLDTAKQEALAKAEAAVAELNELGFTYQLIEGTPTPAPRQTRTRRAGVRDEVLAEIKKHQDGISRQDLMEALHATGDKKRETSISNAVANLKKAGDITAEQGHYTAQ